MKEVKNINRLDEYIGQEIGYKQITDILELRYYKGKSKDAQLKLISQYYKLEKVKTKYRIIEKHDEPIPITDNRQSPYYDDLEVTILYALQNSEQFINTWSITEALIVTSLVNSNYRIGKKDIRLTAEALEIDVDYLNTFYQSIHSRFRDIFENALKRMQNKKLIDYKEVVMIHKRVPKIKLNDLGIPIVDDNGRIQYTTDKVYTEATDKERQYILKVERKVLKDMGYDKVSLVVAAGKYYKYKYNVNEILKKKLNIEYYYKAYSIVHNKEDIVEAITEIKNAVAEDSLNGIKISTLNNSKDKILNKDLDSKEVCIDMLVNKYPIADLKVLLSNYLREIKAAEAEADIDLPF